MEFKKYQHIERLGTSEVQNIELGTCYIFPKIDGTNGSVWIDDHIIKAGSRNRELTLDKDNAGFYNWVCDQDNIKSLLAENPNIRLYGEWLVPHSLKTYRDESWKNFYVFDVMDKDNRYMSYEIYQPLLEQYNINYIPPLAIIENPSYEQLIAKLDANNYLIQNGKGKGEGIVIKNYDFYNKYGRQTWAKLVTSEFKEKNLKTIGAPKSQGTKLVEQEIAQKYITKALCEKVKAKIELENDGFRGKDIPRLLSTVYYDLIREESWNFIKHFKNPAINYKTLHHFVTAQIKINLPELF